MPKISVAVAVLDAGRVLLTLREDFPVWCLPGGSVEAGESVAEAAVREVREETGLEIELRDLVGVYSRPLWEDGGNHAVVFTAHPLSSTLALDPHEVVDARYFEPGNFPERMLWWHRYYLRDALTGVRGSVARSLAAVWPLAQGLSRAEIYRLRDQGMVSEAMIEPLWREPGA